jgi:predicted deacylase
MFNKIKYSPDKTFLDKNLIMVFPMANPDGVYQAMHSNAQGYDLNDMWSGTKAYEVNLMKKYILAFDKTCKGKIKLALDMHSANAGKRNASFIHTEKTQDYAKVVSLMRKYTTYDGLEVKNSVSGQARYWLKTNLPNALTVTMENVQTNTTNTRDNMKLDGEGLLQVIKQV